MKKTWKYKDHHTEATRKRISRKKDGRIGFCFKIQSNESERLRKQLERVKGTNKKHILKFYHQVQADGLVPITIRRYLFILNELSGMLGKDFRRADKNDIVRVCGEIERKYTNERTKAMRKITLKKLYKVIEGDNEEYPKKVRWIKVRNGINRKLPEDILTEKDVKRIVKACRNIREKSFIAMLYLSGCRCSELLNLRIHEIQFDKKGMVFMVNGTKTPGSQRRVRITSGIEMLKSWLEEHPDPKPDSLVWLMDYWASRGLFRKINRRMNGFSKHIHAHAFRRARATHLAGEGLNSYLLMNFFGWRKPETALWYISLSGKQLDDSLCSLPGMVF